MVALIKGSNISWVFVVLYNVLVIASSGDLLHGRYTSAGCDCAGGSSAYKRQHGGNEIDGMVKDNRDRSL
jgi:hypothetical protein